MIETVPYAGWKSCKRLANQEVEVIVTQEVGPRIVRFAFLGGQNQFHEFPEQMGKTGGDEWRIFGGHRLWHSPEEKPRSYMPDNSPIEVTEVSQGLRAVQPTEPETGIQKEMLIQISATKAHVRVTHRLTNRGQWGVELAPWALSVMAQGGTAVVPEPTAQAPYGLLPNRTLVLWPYSNLSDPRHVWGNELILLHQDPKASAPTKFGINNVHGWGAYVNGGTTFVKKFPYFEGVEYVDGGCSMECYTAADFLELESLGPLHLLDPGDTAEHVEDWFLLKGGDASSEQAAKSTVVPLVADLESDLDD
ncbi:MAG TPA: hypothetical protein VGN26_24085 [Armatimonadota bacterium]|jgi:hypothetical protein